MQDLKKSRQWIKLASFLNGNEQDFIAATLSAQVCMIMPLVISQNIVWVISVMFCLGHVGLTQFTKYPSLIQILRTLIMVSGPDQSNTLNVLDSDDGNVSPDSPQDIWRDWL